MGRLVLLYLFIGITMGLAACAPQLEPEESCNFVQNSLDRRVSWAISPLTVGVDVNMPSEFYPEVERAIKTWGEVLGRPNLFNPELRYIQPDQINQVNVSLLWMRSWNSNSAASSQQNGIEQANTEISFQSDNVYRATIYYNAAQNQFSVLPEPGRTHIASLTLHELGHALGLDHVANVASVMYPKLRAGTERMEPTEEDINSLHCEY